MIGTKRKVIVQPRDRYLLTELGSVMRVADRMQSQIVAPWRSVTRANARLLLLTSAGWLERFFIGTIDGGRRAIYTLSPQGAALVGATYRGIRRRSGRLFNSDLFAEHQLRINEIYLAIKFTSLPSGVTFKSWRTFYDPISPLISLMPDGYFEIETAQGIRPAFLEVDLGTEPQPIWREKIRRYLQLATSGGFSAIFHQERFRVLVIANSEPRLKQIRKTAAELTEKLFWFSTFDAIHRDGLWSPIWLRPSGDQRQSPS